MLLQKQQSIILIPIELFNNNYLLFPFSLPMFQNFFNIFGFLWNYVYVTISFICSSISYFSYLSFANSFTIIHQWPGTGGSVGLASGCHSGDWAFNSGQINSQGLKITDEKVLPLGGSLIRLRLNGPLKLLTNHLSRNHTSTIKSNQNCFVHPDQFSHNYYIHTSMKTT